VLPLHATTQTVPCQYPATHAQGLEGRVHRQQCPGHRVHLQHEAVDGVRGQTQCLQDRSTPTTPLMGQHRRGAEGVAAGPWLLLPVMQMEEEG
jgi:hypothetical protein